MNTTFTQSYGVIGATQLNSTVGEYINLAPLKRQVTVLYKNGSVYTYYNVSMRAILKFIMDDARSIGKFINNVLMQPRVTFKQWHTCSWV